MCEAFKHHIAPFLGTSGGRDEDNMVNFSTYLHGLPRLSTRQVKRCEAAITAADVRDAMEQCSKEKTLGLVDLH